MLDIPDGCAIIDVEKGAADRRSASLCYKEVTAGLQARAVTSFLSE